MTDAAAGWSVADPFDLPDWLGAEELRWTTKDTGPRAGIVGVLTGSGDHALGLDMLCADTGCEAMRRFAKAIGVPPSQLSVVLRL